jgi:hypothetical protein
MSWHFVSHYFWISFLFDLAASLLRNAKLQVDIAMVIHEFVQPAC